MYRPLSQIGQVYPIAHRRFVYFLAGEKNRDIFMKDPLQFVTWNSYLPLLPVKIAVIGPPKSGKTALSERLSRSLGLKVISVGQSIRYVLDELGWTELATTIQQHLSRGEVVPMPLAVRCVEAATLDYRSITQGFVLDGFPNTVSQMKELTAISIIPYLIISLEYGLPTCTQHLQGETETFFSRAPTFPAELLEYKYNVWQKVNKTMMAYLQTEYHNVELLDAEHGRWWLYDKAQQKVHAIMKNMCKYFQDLVQDKAMRLNRLCVTNSEFCERQSQFQNYCPACLKLDGHLKSGGLPPGTQGLTQYMDQYFWVCDKHLPLFLASPSQFVPPRNTISLPKHLPQPVQVSGTDMKNVAKDGFCIVTYCENLPQQRLMKGLPEYGVRYRGQLYLFLNVDCQDRFVQAPEAYCNREIHMLTPSLPPLHTLSLPCMGFLEQMAVQLIHKAVTAVGIDRPKYPGLDMYASAAIHMGYSLKTLNPRTPPDELYLFEEARNLSLHRCQIVKRMFRSTKKRNPFLSLGCAGEPC